MIPAGVLAGSARRPVGRGRRGPGDGRRDPPDGARAGLGVLVCRALPGRGRRLRHVRGRAQGRHGVVPHLVLRHALGRDGGGGSARRTGRNGATGLARRPFRLARGARGGGDRDARRRPALPGVRSRRAPRASGREGSSPWLARSPHRTRPGPGEPPHVAALPRVLLPLLGDEQPPLLGRALPPRRLRPRDGRRSLLRHGDVAGAVRRRAADRLRLGPRAPPASAALHGPDGRPVRGLARVRPDPGPPAAGGTLRPALR